MDKLITRDWMKSFGSINYQVLHASERYFEVATEVQEPNLAWAHPGPLECQD